MQIGPTRPPEMPATSGGAKKRAKVNVDDVVEKLDAVLLAVAGAARLAWSSEHSEEAALVTVEVAAILDLATKKLNDLSRELAGSKDG